MLRRWAGSLFGVHSLSCLLRAVAIFSTVIVCSCALLFLCMHLRWLELDHGYDFPGIRLAYYFAGFMHVVSGLGQTLVGVGYIFVLASLVIVILRRIGIATFLIHWKSWTAILLLVGLGSYLFWTCRVVYDLSLDDRGFPYPDAIILAIHDWLDEAYKVDAGTLKLHGEIARLKLIIKSLLSVTIVVACIPARFLMSTFTAAIDPAICKGCSYSLQGTLAAGNTECPECGAAIETAKLASS